MTFQIIEDLTCFLSFLLPGIQAGVSNGGWGWGAAFTDFNNDGFQDLIMTGGKFALVMVFTVSKTATKDV